MKYHKGKWKANYKDTFDLSCTLNPIIGATLVKYKEVITDNEHAKGLPCAWITDMVGEGVVSYEDDGYSLSDGDYEKTMILWLEMLDKCIYAFTAEEPDVMKYNFSFNRVCEDTDEVGCIPFTLECTNEEENERFNKDTKGHYDKVQEGRILFGKYLESFWW